MDPVDRPTSLLMTDILDPNYESDLTEEEHDQLVLMSEHAVAPPLSPATRTVLDAFRSSHTGPGCLAAALRAVADQVVPECQITPGGSKIWPSEPVPSIRAGLLAIADELEGHHA